MKAAEAEFLKSLTDYLQVSNKESDRGKVLVAMSQIDGMLEEILLAFLSHGPATDQLFKGPNAPLGSLFNKSNFARSLGLLSEKEFLAIGTMRKIRNAFAHSVSATFDDQSLQSHIGSLSFGIDSLLSADDKVAKEPRTRFSMCSISLVSNLYNRAHFVSKNKIKETSWPT